MLKTGGGVGPRAEEPADALERATADDWRRWLARSSYSGRWRERRPAFVQSEDCDVLDASLLLMPLVHFIGPTDPRWLSTPRVFLGK